MLRNTIRAILPSRARVVDSQAEGIAELRDPIRQYFLMREEACAPRTQIHHPSSMWSIAPPLKRITRAEYSVLFAALSSVSILLGGIGLVFAFRAPAQQHEAAVALYRYSGCSIAFGVVLILARWGYRRLTD